LLYAIGVIHRYVQWTHSVFAAGPLGRTTLERKNSVE
jgi:hypothetical protein